MEQDALFDMNHTALPEPEELSADRRRTLRNQALVDAGHHPLRYLGAQRHPDTKAETYTREDRKDRHLTCGTCRFREVHAGYPNCMVGDGSRATHGAASDVRMWWPACTRYEEKERPQ